MIPSYSTLSFIKLTIIILSALLFYSCGSDIEPYVDDTTQALEMLDEQRTQALAALEQNPDHDDLMRLIELGLWDDLRDFLDEHSDESHLLAEANFLFKQHRYSDAEVIVNRLIEADSDNRDALLLNAKLNIQAWLLDEADEIAAELLSEDSRDAGAALIYGQVALLNREYDEALEWAQKAQNWNPDDAGGYLLEAEARFWDQNPAAAEPSLRKGLSINPFNADARFSYGYAIWRRVDATLLDDMAAHWNIAFEVNPLHYLAHWHFGNGHTNLTYSDYRHSTDEDVRARLVQVEDLIRSEDLGDAIALTRNIEGEYPESVLPTMTRGSIFYMYYDMDRDARLDSAQTTFETILDRKQNYGPAHNGLAAVIKQRQFEYLYGFEELQQELENTEVPEEGSEFYNIFKDAEYYPGDRVTKMIAQQIGPSEAYLPLIDKLDSDFAIPPLHIDLAEAMGRNYFRHGTTFDNRQWMDIRGVGSGATGIEYLERGAHWERNVLAHEYAHLYHGRILTDKESRRIRELYHLARENNRTLDYYANNNEGEFFAQGYPGFLSEKKVHPLNHKSMNTREYIREKDPDYYAFLDSLLQKQMDYMAGNTELFDDNWSQTYLTLAERSRGNDLELASAYLDTALTYSSTYQPSLLEYAEVHAEKGNFDAAREMLSEAVQVDDNYGPVYSSEAFVIHREALQGIKTFDEALDEQVPLLQRAYDIDNDLAEKASVNRLLRERYRDYGQLDKAIETAEYYAENGPEISTYLRDRKEAADAFARNLRSQIGYSAEEAEFFSNLVAQNPQNFGYRLMYADLLYRLGDLDNSLRVLEEGQRILASAGENRMDYQLRIARINIIRDNLSGVDEVIESAEEMDLNLDDQLLLARTYANIDQLEKGLVIVEDTEGDMPVEMAEISYTRGYLARFADNAEKAETEFKTALSHTPYHMSARTQLADLLKDQGRDNEAGNIRSAAENLPIPLGPDF